MFDRNGRIDRISQLTKILLCHPQFDTSCIVDRHLLQRILMVNEQMQTFRET